MISKFILSNSIACRGLFEDWAGQSRKLVGFGPQPVTWSAQLLVIGKLWKWPIAILVL